MNQCWLPGYKLIAELRNRREETKERKQSEGLRSLPSPLSTLLSQGFEFVHELINVLELAVDRREPDIGNLVELVQLLHDFFADDPTFNFTFAHLLDPLLDAIRDVLDRGRADGSFLAGFLEAGQDFRAVERLAPPVFLHDYRENFFNPLVGRIAAFTAETLAAPSNDLAFLGHTRVHHLVFELVAERTFHWWRPCPYACGLVGVKNREAVAQRLRLSTDLFQDGGIVAVL